MQNLLYYLTTVFVDLPHPNFDHAIKQLFVDDDEGTAIPYEFLLQHSRNDAEWLDLCVDGLVDLRGSHGFGEEAEAHPDGANSDLECKPLV